MNRRDLLKTGLAAGTIAGHILEFLSWEVQKGRMPANLLPLQSGVGNITNAVSSGRFQ